jgi:hypothetical protein
MQVSKYLRKSSDGYLFYCPACEGIHAYRVGGDPARPQWSFNGNVEKPTFTPSLLCFTTYGENDGPDGKPQQLPNGRRRTLCHLFVTDGKIIYCGDNPHKLNGQTVPLPELPDWASDDRYGDGNP